MHRFCIPLPSYVIAQICYFACYTCQCTDSFERLLLRILLYGCQCTTPSLDTLGRCTDFLPPTVQNSIHLQPYENLLILPLYGFWIALVLIVQFSHRGHCFISYGMVASHNIYTIFSLVVQIRWFTFTVVRLLALHSPIHTVQ